MIHGIDVSQYQGMVDWTEVRKTQDFAFIRAIPLAAWDTAPPTIDTHFKSNWIGAKWHGMIAGPYAFARMDVDPSRFAGGFLDCLSGIGYGTLGDLPPVLDVEAPPPGSVHRSAHDALSVADRRLWVAEVLDELEAATGRVPVVYTGVYYWNTAFAGVDQFARHPLWLARYRARIEDGTELPAGWPKWRFWQWTSSGNTSGYPSVPGVPGRVDLNVFDGSRADLYQL